MARRKATSTKSKPRAQNQEMEQEQDPNAVHNNLCKDFPEIDSSLILAMLNDTPDFSRDSLDSLTKDLEALALSARVEDASTSSSRNDPWITQDDTDEPGSSIFSDSLFPDSSRGSSSPSSDLSSVPGMEFLLAIFPGISTTSLQRALENHGGLDAEEIDMAQVVDDLLSMELIRELEERGLDEALPQDERTEEQKRDWSLVEKKKPAKQPKKGKSMPASSMEASSSGVPKTFVLSDVRQQANRQLSLRPLGIPTNTTSAVVSDPWSYISSLSTRLSELLPSYSASHFSSLFHNPSFTSPAEALRHGLSRIGEQDKDPPDFDAALIRLVELLQCRDSQSLREARMCLRAARSDVETAWDLVELLRDLDGRDPIVIHSPIVGAAQSSIPHPLVTNGRSNSFANAIDVPLPLSPIAQTLPPVFDTPLQILNPPSEAKPKGKYRAGPWTKVNHTRKRNLNKPAMVYDPLGAFIPAYSSKPEGWRTESGRSANEPDAEEEVDEAECRRWAAHYRERRDQALREATRYWRGGNGSRGGDVAFYYAEESRNYDSRSRQWSLKAAEAMVRDRQTRSKDDHTLDLHGTTIQEALRITKRAVNDWWETSLSDRGATPAKPLSIITGVGNHSKGKVGVIGPAVKNWLENEGWRIHQRPGAIVVSGSTRRRF